MKLLDTKPKVSRALVAELKYLLAEANSGHLRGMLFVAHRVGSDTKRYGNVGDYSLADFALGIKLAELELDSIVAADHEPE